MEFLLGVATASDIALLLRDLGEGGLDDQEYLIRTVERNGNQALLLAGGSPAAVLWAVYELAEFWGVRFLFGGDVLPAQGSELTVPARPLRRRPLFALRCWRGMNQLPHSGAYWGLADYCGLIDQLAKMRFNGFHLALQSFGPFGDYEWGGVRKRSADLSFGWRFPIDGQTIGRERFGHASWYENPDIPYEGTYEQKIAAARKLAAGIRDHARSRGMGFGIRIAFTQFPEEFRERLRELSLQDGFSPAGAETGYVYRLGMSREGMDPAHSPFMSVRNPRFVDLAAAQLRAYLTEFPDADWMALSPPEFANGGVDVEFAWEALSRRYDLPPSEAPARIIETAKRELEADSRPISSERLEQQIRGHICTLHLLDELLNRRGLLDLCKTSRPRLVIGLPFPALAQVTGKVLGLDMDIMTTLGSGYLPSDAARHADQLAQVCGQAQRAHLTVSIEDDNIGVTPQFTAPSLAKIVGAMRRYGVTGLWGRQWLLSKLEPAVFFLSHACWDEALTPEDAYRSLVQGVCGEQAVGALLDAFRLAEQITRDNDDASNIHTFLTPMLLSLHWEMPDLLKETMLAMRPKYNRLAESLQKARGVSRPEGRAFVDQFIGQTRFAGQWITVMEKVRDARRASQNAELAREARDVDRMDRHLQACVALLDEAVGVSEAALRSWADAVRDRADLGVLAALNHYGHRYLLARRHIQYVRADQWAMASPKAGMEQGAI